MLGVTAFLVFSCFRRTECRFSLSNFYVSHRSIVLRAVHGKGHGANPTCCQLSQILVCNLLAGWGATFATGHRYYFDSQKALSSWVYVPTRNNDSPLVPNKHSILMITEPFRNYKLASGFTSEVINHTIKFQRSKWRYFFHLSVLNTSLG